MIGQQNRIVFLDERQHRFGELLSSGSLVGRHRYLADENLALGDDAGRWNAVRYGVRGSVRRMAVHHGLRLRHGFVDLQVQQNLAGAGTLSGELVPFQVHQAQILGPKIRLTEQSRSANCFVRTNAERDIAPVAVHVHARPQLLADGADLGLDGLGLGRREEAQASGAGLRRGGRSWDRRVRSGLLAV